MSDLTEAAGAQPPCAAYHALARILPPSYFESYPEENPQRVVVLHATGHDGVATRWLIPHPLANAVHAILRASHHLKHFRWAPWTQDWETKGAPTDG